MPSIFESIDALHPQTTGFDLSHTVDFDCKLGECIPFLCEEMVPKDTFKVSNSVKVRFQPLVAPISDYVEVKTDYFFVPNRLVFNEDIDGAGNSWEKFITQVPTDNSSGTPTFAVTMPKWHPTKNTVYSLWDYFGHPVGVSPAGLSAPDDLHHRGYNLIWNEFYRDENLQDEVDLENEDVLFTNVSKDYFTSAFTERQRGPVTGLPVSTTLDWSGGAGLPWTFEHRYDDSTSFGSYTSETGSIFLRGNNSNDESSRVNFVTSDGTESGTIVGMQLGYKNVPSSQTTRSRVSMLGTGSTVDNPHINKQGMIRAYIPADKVLEDLTVQSTSFDISDLRLAYQVQKWQERSLRGGVRYTEFLHSFFGVNPRDDRLQRPEYIGGTRSPVITQDIIQTSETTQSSAQGTEAGHMISADANIVRSYTALEYGYIFGIMRIVPKIKYTNGINRQFLRNTPFDFYFPVFAHLSEQGIYNEEVFATNSEEDNLTIWGYQGIFNEMRYKPSKVLAGLRQSNNGFLYWTMARKFTSLPTLNENFISTEYMQNDFMRVFQITDENLTRPCIVHIYNGIKAFRPMPFLATPV